MVKLKTRSEHVFDTSRDVSTVIAADHEEGRLAQRKLGPSLDRIPDFVRLQTRDAELIVGDGAAQDRTADLVRDYANNHGIVRLQEMRQNRGKGYWVPNGAMNAQGRIITRMLISRPLWQRQRNFLPCWKLAPTSRSDRVRCAANGRRHANLWCGRGREGASIFNLLLRMVSRPELPRYTIGLQGVSSKRPENGFFSTKDRTLGL